MPAAVVFLLFGELRLFEAIWQLATGRRDLRPGETGIGYARGRLVVELVFVGGALIELVAVDLLVPWDRLGSFAGLRLVVLVASLYGVIWIALWMVSERTRPHLATADALVLRWGHLPIATVPWSSIREVRVHRRYSADSDRLTHDVPLQGTNLDIELNAAMLARVPFTRRRPPVTGLSLGVDDPLGAAELIRSRLTP